MYISDIILSGLSLFSPGQSDFFILLVYQNLEVIYLCKSMLTYTGIRKTPFAHILGIQK